MRRKLVPGLILIFLTLTPLTTCAATDQVTISLLEAIDLAFKQNVKYQLSIWENELNHREQKLKEKTPTIRFSSTPFEVSNGDISPSKGNLTMTFPVTDHTTLTGTLDVWSKNFEFEIGRKA